MPHAYVQAITYNRVKPVYKAAATEGPFVGETSNKADFPSWGAPVTRTAMRQPGIARVSGPFEGQSVYADTFK